jgi:PleD family two-component response regulator
MIDDAQHKFLNPDTKIRREAIERLWDCWERIKTLENPTDKKKSISALLDKASAESETRLLLEDEARKLTDIGNAFHIRHSEATQVVISDNNMIDYLFYRLFAFIQMLLSSR